MEELTQAAQLEERPNVGEGDTERGLPGFGESKGEDPPAADDGDGHQRHNKYDPSRCGAGNQG